MSNTTSQSTAEKRLSRKEIEDSLARAFYTLDITAQAINRLETFTFGLTKLLKDKEVVGLDELDKTMQVLVHHEDLGQYWDCDVNTFTPPVEEDDEVAFDSEFDSVEDAEFTEEAVANVETTTTE